MTSSRPPPPPGHPLAEIRDYLTCRSPQALLALLEEKEAQLAEERRRLEAVSRLLQTAMDTTRLAPAGAAGEIRLSELPPAHWVPWWRPRTSPAGSLRRPVPLHIRQLLAWAGTRHRLLASGDIICRESMEKGDFMEDYYFCLVPLGTQGWPSGCGRGNLCGALYHQGSYQSEYAACRQWEGGPRPGIPSGRGPVRGEFGGLHHLGGPPGDTSSSSA